jgi:hypothetical protein
LDSTGQQRFGNYGIYDYAITIVWRLYRFDAGDQQCNHRRIDERNRLHIYIHGYERSWNERVFTRLQFGHTWSGSWSTGNTFSHSHGHNGTG